MPKVIQVRDVPDDVHDALAATAAAEGLSLTRYLQRELTLLSRRATLTVAHNMDVIRRTQHEVQVQVDRATILSAIHEGRGVQVECRIDVV
ncbi:hypothetical protein [Nocardia camponoti]|uniref:Antitoxin n=1 Tax=Nocardia camponoti TaxID=1616106 RepID=A0A917QKN5_9NOCA|nr:hypothetical protein [Nocardia camponoti]GGK55006.1 hypothetical protein GCM10011591_28650 [Nocardia camponoti]